MSLSKMQVTNLHRVVVDLHSHSGYAGGVGDIPLISVARAMQHKGIDVFGSGDCLFPTRVQELKAQLQEVEEGLFSLKNFPRQRFLLQSEIILTSRLPGAKNKLTAHHLILFPNYGCIETVQNLFHAWGVKNTVGRPTLVTESLPELEDKLFAIYNCGLIEIIPAHIMTPDGVLGTKNKLEHISQFYGAFLPYIKAVETGLSADPSLLSQIPGVHNLAMLSNSDCHSAALNRIGREFTVLECEAFDYTSIIRAIRSKNIVLTAEFNPAEGRYYACGHKKGRAGHEGEDFFSEETAICPICGKTLEQGVKARCHALRDSSLPGNRQDFISIIPLVEVIAFSKQLKNINHKKVTEDYHKILKVFPSETDLWLASSQKVEDKLDKTIDNKTLCHIIAVKNGNFTFFPPGFDGNYGVLQIFQKGESHV